jgi:hypothetical protein
MGGYWYEIIGGLLIVLSSLVGEEMRHKWKITFYVFFAVVALAYSGIGIYMRRDARAEEQQQKNELIGVRKDMSNLISASKGLLPSLESLNSDVAMIRKDLEAGKGNRNPGEVASLETRADAAGKRVGNASKAVFGAMVPLIARQLRSWKEGWDTPEGKGLILNAQYLYDGLMQGVLQPIRNLPCCSQASTGPGPTGTQNEPRRH